jgi:hypothetical protein
LNNTLKKLEKLFGMNCRISLMSLKKNDNKGIKNKNMEKISKKYQK